VNRSHNAMYRKKEKEKQNYNRHERPSAVVVTLSIVIQSQMPNQTPRIVTGFALCSL
jgi:hypothetical protein